MKRPFALLLVLLLIALGGCLTSDSGDDDDDGGDTLGHTVTGRVVDDDGNGIPSVKVTLNAKGAKAAAPPSTYTNDGGYYALTNVSDGDYILTMEKEGYDFEPVGVTVDGGNTDAGATSASDNGGSVSGDYSISGRVTKENGDGVPNVGIVANIVNSEDLPFTASTDEKGNYVLSGLANGEYMLLLMADNYTIDPLSAFVTISGGNVTQNFSAEWIGTGEEGVIVSGTITNEDGETVETVFMEILVSGGTGDDFFGSDITDDKGSYAINNVPPGEFTLQWSSNKDIYVTGSRLITVGSTNMTEDAVIESSGITPSDSYSIVGNVFSLDEDPLSGIFAVLTVSATKQIHTLTDQYGIYTFTEIPNGSYTVSLSKDGYTIAPSSFNVTVDNEDAFAGVSQISAGSGGDTDTYTVSGHVEDESGSGLGGIGLILSDGTNQYSEGSDASGNYVFTDIPVGTYTLTPQNADYEFTPQSQTVNIQSDTTVDVFSAESGEGGTDPGDAGGNAGSHEYFPMKRGATWTSKEHITDKIHTFSVVGTTEFDGELWWKYQHDTEDIAAYYRIDNGIVYQYYPSIPGMSGKTPYEGTLMSLDLNASVGDTFEFIDFSNTEDGMTMGYKGTAEYVGKETVTVEAGTFSDCMKYVLTVSMDMNFGDFTSTTIIESTGWYARGVGRVKEAVTTTTDGETEEEPVIELVSYSIP